MTWPSRRRLGSRVISRANVKALRKDVLSKCYGGDVTQKAQAVGKAEKGQKAHEKDRARRDPPGSLYDRAPAGRGIGIGLLIPPKTKVFQWTWKTSSTAGGTNELGLSFGFTGGWCCVMLGVEGAAAAAQDLVGAVVALFHHEIAVRADSGPARGPRSLSQGSVRMLPRADKVALAGDHVAVGLDAHVVPGCGAALDAQLHAHRDRTRSTGSACTR